MRDVTIYLPLIAVPKGRQRSRVRWARSADGRPTPAGTQSYTPETTRAFEAAVADMAAARIGGLVLEGPLRVDILVVRQRPKRLLPRSHPDGLDWAPTKPDRDNVEKAVLDGLAACMRDDAQVVCGETLKVYAERSGCPRVVIRLRELGEQDLFADITPEALARRLGLLEVVDRG